MTLSWGVGENWGGILTYGMNYAYITITVEAPSRVGGAVRKRVKRIKIEKEHIIKLQKLNLLDFRTGSFKISWLNLLKLKNIYILINSLKIQLPSEIKILLDSLSNIVLEEEFIRIDKISLIKDFSEELKQSILKLLKRETPTLTIKPLALVESLKKIVNIQASDLGLMTVAEYMDYLELIKLLENLSEELE